MTGESTELMEVQLYSDGSSRGNPGPGGFGTLLRFIDPAGGIHEKEISAGFARTTNNRMELMGVIAGVEALKFPCRITVVSDSQYVVKAFNDHWIEGWLKRGWKSASRQPVKNVDLWQRLLAALEGHQATFHWVRGHEGHPENERCDTLATAAADSDALQEDPGAA